MKTTNRHNPAFTQKEILRWWGYRVWREKGIKKKKVTECGNNVLHANADLKPLTQHYEF